MPFEVVVDSASDGKEVLLGAVFSDAGIDEEGVAEEAVAEEGVPVSGGGAA